MTVDHLKGVFGTEELELHHLGFVVPDMECAIDKWLMAGADMIVEPGDDEIQGVRCCLLRLAHGVDIELVSPILRSLTEPHYHHPLATRLDNGGGLDHLCLLATNLDDILANVRAKRLGVIICAPVYASVFATDIAFIKMRTGLIVEFMKQK